MNMKNKKLIPQLRFPEFQDTGEWEIKRLGEVSQIFKGKGISKKDINEKGNFFCIRYGELYTDYKEVINKVNNRTNLSQKELIFGKFNDVLIPSSGETKEDIASSSCLDVDYVAIGGDINIIRSDLNGVFLSYLMRGNLKKKIAQIAQGDSIVHLYPNQLKKLLIPYPSLPEQKKIADFLSKIDALIDLYENKLNQLQEYKRGLLQNLFPKPGSKLPRYRFPEFKDAGEWEIKLIGDFIEEKNIRNNNLSNVLSISNKFGFIEQHSLFNKRIASSNLKSYKLIKKGWFGYNPSRINIGSLALLENQKEGIVSPLYFIFEPKDINPFFLKYFFQTGLFKDFVFQFLSGSVRKSLKLNDLKKIKIYTPSLREQKKIADFLKKIDTLIQLTDEKLEQLKNYKKGLLQQMFPEIE